MLIPARIRQSVLEYADSSGGNDVQMNSKIIEPAANPSKKAEANVYETAVVRSETKSGASSLDSRSTRRRYLFLLAGC
jgi:hypothetical protein